jgi:hypothetical protein
VIRTTTESDYLEIHRCTCILSFACALKQLPTVLIMQHADQACQSPGTDSQAAKSFETYSRDRDPTPLTRNEEAIDISSAELNIAQTTLVCRQPSRVSTTTKLTATGSLRTRRRLPSISCAGDTIVDRTTNNTQNFGASYGQSRPPRCRSPDYANGRNQKWSTEGPLRSDSKLAAFLWTRGRTTAR